MKYREFPMMRKITILLALTVAMAFTACDGQTVSPGSKPNNNVVANNDDPDKEDEDLEPTPADPEEEGHGADDDSVTLDAGFLSGSWRVASVEDDKPIAYFDIIHVEGESEISGTYMMGNGINDELADENGDIVNASYADSKIELVWNPTQDFEELYIVKTTERIDNDHFKGVLTGEQDTEMSIPVTIQRQIFED